MRKLTHYPINYCLYNAGLLETLTFSHEREVHWFMSSDTNGVVYFDYIIGDDVPSFVKVIDLL